MCEINIEEYVERGYISIRGVNSTLSYYKPEFVKELSVGFYEDGIVVHKEQFKEFFNKVFQAGINYNQKQLRIQIGLEDV